MKVMREIEKITIKMVMKYHGKIKMAIRRPPWQGGKGGTILTVLLSVSLILRATPNFFNSITSIFVHFP